MQEFHYSTCLIWRQWPTNSVETSCQSAIEWEKSLKDERMMRWLGSFPEKSRLLQRSQSTLRFLIFVNVTWVGTWILEYKFEQQVYNSWKTIFPIHFWKSGRWSPMHISPNKEEDRSSWAATQEKRTVKEGCTKSWFLHRFGKKTEIRSSSSHWFGLDESNCHSNLRSSLSLWKSWHRMIFYVMMIWLIISGQEINCCTKSFTRCERAGKV